MQVHGLTSEEAGKKLQKFGLNVLPEAPPTSDFKILFRQLRSPLIYILLVASVISFLLKDFSDGLVILFAVLVNSILGFYQERKAERGLVALKQILSPQARAIRDGKINNISAKEVVPGDFILLSAGDRVPADGVLIESSGLTINEAILTGESVPVSKYQISDVKHSEENIEKEFKAFMGTTVVGGLGKILVTKTGLSSELGAIATTLSETAEVETPLQRRFAKLAHSLTVMVVIAAGVIFTAGILRGESWVDIFTTSVAVAVAAIPEGLVIAVTVTLALGMQQILKRKALVRKLVVAETLGTVTVIATDKTGTLTQGKLQVVKTDFTNKDEALLAATFANHLVDPLEHALWEWLTTQTKSDPQEMLAANPRKSLVPFDSHRKFSATFLDDKVYFMGAPEVLLFKSISPSIRQKYKQMIDDWAREGLRVLALGVKYQPDSYKNHSIDQIKEINFLGLVGFADPVRNGVKEALGLCKSAGIGVKVVTGDYRFTAETVMRKVGLLITNPEKEILEGKEIESLSSGDLEKRVSEVLLFSRVSATQKLKIVECLKKSGEVVALLGDGVNDAPALKKADIGIVVGEATDVARETADMVLLDSNFATIVAAIEEGRGIFANIQKVMTYLLADTFAEMLLIFFGLISGLPLPLTAAQILWINLVTDIFPTLALTVEPKEKNLLRRKPISPDLPLLTKSVVMFMLVVSITSSVVVFLLFWSLLGISKDLYLARIIAFTTFGFKSLFMVFSLRDHERSIWETPFFANKTLFLAVFAGAILQIIALYVPFFQNLLHTRGLTLIEFVLVIFASLFILSVIEVAKLVRKVLVRRISSS